jgi:peptidoglycan/LPS O-acetylase OafA/YrhL
MLAVRINVTPRVTPGRRVHAVDELKGLAIALIILYHSQGVLGYSNYPHGEIGVDIFLMLSGFTLAMNSVEMPLGQYFLRRFARIYPTYWLALGVTLWLQKELFGATKSWEDIWQHIVGIHAFSRLVYFSDISDPFWFISLIAAAYLVFAVIRKRLDNLSLVVAVAGALSLIATIGYEHFDHAGGLISLAIRIPDFFVGVIAGRLLASGTAELRLNLVLGLGLLCFYFQTFFLSTANNYTLPAVGIIATWIGLRHYLVGSHQGRVFLTAFALLGLISYEVYLIHQPIIRDYNAYIYTHVLNVPAPSKLQLFRGIFIGLGVTFALGAGLHWATEWLWSHFKFRSGAELAPARG